MKKLAVAVLAVLFIAPAAFADNWGVGVKLGAGENDPKDMKAVYDDAVGFNRELDRSAAFLGLEALYEIDLNDEANKLGMKLGVDMYGENKLEISGWGIYDEIKEETYAFPLTVYYKRDNGIRNFSWFAGAGATLIHSKIEEKGSFGKGSWRKNKVFPHVVVGGEYRFTKLFALGVEARYNFGAKTKKDGDVLSDRSGFGGAVTSRFYF